jgi:hypothetical protein
MRAEIGSCGLGFNFQERIELIDALVAEADIGDITACMAAFSNLTFGVRHR